METLDIEFVGGVKKELAPWWCRYLVKSHSLRRFGKGKKLVEKT